MNAPPVARLALALSAGVAWGMLGAPLWTAPLLAMVWLAAPVSTSGSRARAWWLAVALAGAISARSGGDGGGCAVARPGAKVELSGRFLAAPRAGSAPFEPIDGGCGGAFTVVTTDSLAPAGVPVTLIGTWMAGSRRPWFRAGKVRVVGADGGAGFGPRWAAVRWRDGLVERLGRLYGERAPLVAALTLARREGMDRSLNEVFARTGIAHLLAISGFHVGVIAGAALALLRMARLRRRTARLGAAAFAWLYVGLIGFPDAACRAALILGFIALSQAGGRPPARWGALASALVVLLAVDPAKLGSPGFQLSFLGAAGLVAWSRPMTDAIRRMTRGRCPHAAASALAAGFAATLATLPVVAWHFERVSMVGIPVTLAATPLVSLALPGAIATLLVDHVSPGLASFLAGGVDLLLIALEAGTRRVAEWSWASMWVTRPGVAAGLAGCMVATIIARHPRVGGQGRRALLCVYCTIGVVGWPTVLALRGWGTLEIIVIDVGQGDAIALRSPRGRWMLVDAGPPGRGVTPDAAPDPGAHPAVRALRARGVGALEALVLTHPDLDHIGGATAVMESFEIRTIFDPALPAGKAEFLDILALATAQGVPWIAARAGGSLAFDGVTVEVVHPSDAIDEGMESNEASVVLLVRWGTFEALLTGDAYKPAERALAPALGDIEVLKVGHHGSDTSTDSLLLALARPDVALIPVGRHNRYGHPHPDVLGRIERAGVPIHRTDLEGTISVIVRPDGSFQVRSGGPQR